MAVTFTMTAIAYWLTEQTKQYPALAISTTVDTGRELTSGLYRLKFFTVSLHTCKEEL